jgi:hypothetical protein
VGLIERDALFVVMGLIAALVWVAILAIGGPAVIYFIVNFALNRSAGA